MPKVTRAGAQSALRALARGFVGHPRNAVLRDALRSGGAAVEALNAELMRVVLQIAVLLAIEERGAQLRVLEANAAVQATRARYERRLGARRLLHLAETREGGRHGGLWRRFVLLCEALSGDPRREPLRRSHGLLALNMPLLRPHTCRMLTASHLRNRDLLEAVRQLAGPPLGRGGLAHLGAVELGALYEGLLALAPRFDGERLEHVSIRGSARRVSGSYYTPDELVQCLLESALEPIIEEAVRSRPQGSRAEAILALRVCDPAVGAGSFLVGAAQRLAKHLAQARSCDAGVDAAGPELWGQALQDVIARCLHGVDIDPLSVGLCQVGLWLESGASPHLLDALETRIRVGNSIFGATPALIARGLPDEAFFPMQGDDPAVCRALRERNREERREGGAAVAVSHWIEAPTTQAEERHARLLADTWCAALLQPRTTVWEPHAITTGTLRRLMADPQALTSQQMQQVERLSSRHGLFHWHLAFPEVWRRGGFDCVLGNPPWEHAELKEKEWFAERAGHIVGMVTGAERKRRIEALRHTRPALFADFRDARRRLAETQHFVGSSGRYPLCGRGRINLYAVFAEASRALLHPAGRCGCIVPSGIATDDSTKRFFHDVVESRALVSLLDFENKRRLFPDVASPQKFCLLTVGREGAAEGGARFTFFAQAVRDLNEAERVFTLTPSDVALLNPNTRTCPVFRSRRDAELTKAIHRRLPVLARDAGSGAPAESPWGVRFRQGLFNMTSDSHHFRTLEALRAEGGALRGNVFVRGDDTWLPLYEAKMIHHFDHRYNTFEGVSPASRFNVKAAAVALHDKRCPDRVPLPRYWAPAAEVAARWPWAREWALVFRSITNVSTNRRTAVFAVVPRVGIGNSAPLLISSVNDMALLACLYGTLTSFVFDFVARQSVGGTNFNYFIVRQLVAPSPAQMRAPQAHVTGGQPFPEWVLARVLELTYTASDLRPFARDCGFNGAPFGWDDARRFALRCELDAAFFHIFLPADAQGCWKDARRADGCARDESPDERAALQACFSTPRDAVAYILDTFPIVAANDVAVHGEFRTKRAILAVYDSMQAARR